VASAPRTAVPRDRARRLPRNADLEANRPERAKGPRGLSGALGPLPLTVPEVRRAIKPAPRVHTTSDEKSKRGWSIRVAAVPLGELSPRS
jgi:hypothetical protein